MYQKVKIAYNLNQREYMVQTVVNRMPINNKTLGCLLAFPENK